jgi:hypothetical protein
MQVLERQSQAPVRPVQELSASGQPLTPHDTHDNIPGGGSLDMQQPQALVAREAGPAVVASPNSTTQPAIEAELSHFHHQHPNP